MRNKMPTIPFALGRRDGDEGIFAQANSNKISFILAVLLYKNSIVKY